MGEETEGGGGVAEEFRCFNKQRESLLVYYPPPQIRTFSQFNFDLLKKITTKKKQ